MCSRYSIITEPQALKHYFTIDVERIEKMSPPNVTVHANVSCGTMTPVISNDNPKELQLFHFGFTPSWADKKLNIINARVEGVHNKNNDPDYTGAKGIIRQPMFRKAIRSQRCLVLANGFIVGPEKERLDKPYFVYARRRKRPFAMAGLWDEWLDQAQGELIRSFTILTSSANKLLQKIGRQRAPLILRESDESRWLRNDLALSDITSMLRPFDSEDYNAYPIGTAIKSPENNHLGLLKPTGKPIDDSSSYAFHQVLELQGMGNTAARRRREKEKAKGAFGEEQSIFLGGRKEAPESTEDLKTKNEESINDTIQ